MAEIGEHDHPQDIQCSELTAALIIAQAGALSKPHAEYISLSGRRVAGKGRAMARALENADPTDSGRFQDILGWHGQSLQAPHHTQCAFKH